MKDEKTLIQEGVIYLNDKFGFRDMPDKDGKFTWKAPSATYSDRLMRVIRRVKDFIQQSPENTRWFTGLLWQYQDRLEPDLFNLFSELLIEAQKPYCKYCQPLDFKPKICYKCGRTYPIDFGVLT